MRSLSSITGEEALDVIASLLEPASEIMSDPEVADFARNSERVKAVSAAIRGHKKAVLLVMAILEGEDPETYNPPLLRLPSMLLQLFNDPELVQVFTLQGQTQEENVSGSAMVNTEEIEEK